MSGVECRVLDLLTTECDGGHPPAAFADARGLDPAPVQRISFE